MKNKMIPVLLGVMALSSCSAKDNTYAFGSWYEGEKGSVCFSMDRENKRAVFEYKFNEDYFAKHTSAEHRSQLTFKFYYKDQLMKTDGKPKYVQIFNAENNKQLHSDPYSFSKDVKIYISYANAASDQEYHYKEEADFAVRYDDTHIWKNIINA